MAEKIKLKAEIEAFAFDDAAVEGTIIAQSLKAGIKVGQNEVVALTMGKWANNSQ